MNWKKNEFLTKPIINKKNYNKLIVIEYRVMFNYGKRFNKFWNKIDHPDGQFYDFNRRLKSSEKIIVPIIFSYMIINFKIDQKLS